MLNANVTDRHQLITVHTAKQLLRRELVFHSSVPGVTSNGYMNSSLLFCSQNTIPVIHFFLCCVIVSKERDVIELYSYFFVVVRFPDEVRKRCVK